MLKSTQLMSLFGYSNLWCILIIFFVVDISSVRFLAGFVHGKCHGDGGDVEFLFAIRGRLDLGLVEGSLILGGAIDVQSVRSGHVKGLGVEDQVLDVDGVSFCGGGVAAIAVRAGRVRNIYPSELCDGFGTEST